MKRKKKKCQVFSPDNFTIERDIIYTSKKQAVSAYVEWKKRYEKQGYYSTNGKRIPLEDLDDYCYLKEI